MYRHQFNDLLRAQYLAGLGEDPPSTIFGLAGFDLAQLGLSSVGGFVVGQTVEIQDLVARPELNGQHATCKEYVPERGRWRLLVNEEIVGLKTSNLKIIAAPSAMPAVPARTEPEVNLSGAVYEGALETFRMYKYTKFKEEAENNVAPLPKRCKKSSKVKRQRAVQNATRHLLREAFQKLTNEEQRKWIDRKRPFRKRGRAGRFGSGGRVLEFEKSEPAEPCAAPELASEPAPQPEIPPAAPLASEPVVGESPQAADGAMPAAADGLPKVTDMPVAIPPSKAVKLGKFANSRKRKGGGFKQLSSKQKRRHRDAICGIVERCENSDQASNLLNSVFEKLREKFPELEVKQNPDEKKEPCYCKPLLTNLFGVRQEALRTPWSGALDKAVRKTGMSHDSAKNRGYAVDKKAWARTQVAKIGVKQKTLKPGRPSKIDDQKLIRLAESVLLKNSQESSWMAVVPGRKKGAGREHVKVRTITALLSTIYRSAPELRKAMKLQTFRKLRKKHLRHFRNARVKTDLCDHCEAYKYKVIRDSIAIWRDHLETDCAGYFSFFDTQPDVLSVMDKTLGDTDYVHLLTLMLDYIDGHEHQFNDLRMTAKHPALIIHREGKVRKEIKATLVVLEAYEWHQLSGIRETHAAREQVENPAPNTAMLTCDFMEKLGVPLAHRQTSGMFHGSQRKTLSILGGYLVERGSDNIIQKTGIILVSDIVETSAVFANLGVRQCVGHIKNMGHLDRLRLRYDCGTHFRSAENLAFFNVELPVLHKQPTVTSFFVPKHGKSWQTPKSLPHAGGGGTNISQMNMRRY